MKGFSVPLRTKNPFIRHLMTKINWTKLVRQGRAKSEGIAWSEEELKAIYQRGMTAEEVREGLLFPEDRIKQAKIPNREDLIEEAKKLGVEFDREAVTETALKSEIEQKQRNEQNKEPQKEETSEKAVKKAVKGGQKRRGRPKGRKKSAKKSGR